MSAPSSDPVAMLTTMVADLDKRVRKIERIVYTSAGAAAGSGAGTWITIIMTHR